MNKTKKTTTKTYLSGGSMTPLSSDLVTHYIISETKTKQVFCVELYVSASAKANANR